MITHQDIIRELNKFGILDNLEVSHFLAQTDHESGGFKRLSENLNYSSDALVKLFPKRFTRDLANKYGRNSSHPADQKMIANILYGSRLGNENDGTDDDDGHEYRGSGLIQLTGKYNHQKFLDWLKSKGQKLELTIDTVDDFVRTEEGAIISAIWFWVSNEIGKFALNDDVVKVSKLINGGTIGLDDRKLLTIKYKKLLGV